MAGISYTTRGAATNETINVLPVKAAGNTFVDSMISQNDNGTEILFDNVDLFKVNGNIIFNTAGAASGDYFLITINGTDYKISLLAI